MANGPNSSLARDSLLVILEKKKTEGERSFLFYGRMGEPNPHINPHTTKYHLFFFHNS